MMVLFTELRAGLVSGQKNEQKRDKTTYQQATHLFNTQQWEKLNIQQISQLANNENK